MNLLIDSNGIGDTLAGLYAVAGAVSANLGETVTLTTPRSGWARLMVGIKVDNDVQGARKAGAIHVNARYNSELRDADTRVDWYTKNIADAIGKPITPGKPAIKYKPSITPPPSPYIVLSPHSDWPTRAWAWENWISLAEMIVAEGKTPVVIGRDKITDGRDLSTFPKGSLYYYGFKPADVFHLVANAAAAVGNDSMLPHLAALAETPCVAIHAALPASYLYPANLSGYGKVTSITPNLEGWTCAPCRFQRKEGFGNHCARYCGALQSISPHRVARELFEIFE